MTKKKKKRAGRKEEECLSPIFLECGSNILKEQFKRRRKERKKKNSNGFQRTFKG